ncbi:ribonuclease H-like domain-containing protein [Tanacetum coccineum]
MWLFRRKYLADETFSRYKARLMAIGSMQLSSVDVDETFSRYKARLMAIGSMQLSSVDVDETFSPVVKLGTIQTVLMYMHQPSRFRDSAHPDYVCLLQRSIYNLSRSLGLGADTAYLLLYVDDIVLTTSSEILMFLSQRKYANKILERAHMVSCNSSQTLVYTESKLVDDGDTISDPTLYRSLAGSLQHLTFTRSDISNAVQQVCLYMHDPWEPHFLSFKRILRYVRCTLDHGLQLFSSSTTSLVAYSDADWAGCPATRRLTSDYCVFLGNNLHSWYIKRQPTLSRSSAETKYCGAANAVAETC